LKLFSSIKEDIKSEIMGISLIVVSIYCLYVLYNNSGGYLGWAIYRILRGMAGQGAMGIPILFVFIGINTLFDGKNNTITKTIGILLFLLAYIQTIHIIFVHVDFNLSFSQLMSHWVDMGLDKKGGGLIGGVLTYLTNKLLGRSGTYILITTQYLISLMLMFEFTLKKLFASITIKEQPQGVKKVKKNKKELLIPIEAKDLAPLKDDFIEPQGKNHKNTEIEIIDYSNNVIKEEPIIPSIKALDKEDSEPISQGDNGDYQLPSINLLLMPAKFKGREQDVSLMAKKLEDTLESFGVKGKVVKAQRGPTVTRFELQPERGVKVSRILNLSDDIALAMATADVRIEAPIPGKAAVGIEVPNKNISTVCLREVIDSDNYRKSSSYLTVALGKDIAGNPIVSDLSKMPHLLIAGATGSGKSVCINSVIISLLYKASPSDVKLLMIDPKMVELNNYNGIPHLVSPVVTDPRKAATVLEWAVLEMDKRYKKLSELGIKDINRYNEYMVKNNEKKLPNLVIIIDELADLMMIAPTEVEDSICRLAQKARAAGIHLIVATQRPSVDVITGLIKANIPSRISFAVSSQIDSRTILDMNGAEKLLGNGDMLFYPYGASKPLRLQGSYISDGEVESIVSFVKQGNEPRFLMDPEKLISNSNKASQKQEAEDPMFIDAVTVVFENAQASISLLQRRLHIGYNRSARLIDEMESRGIIGKYEGTKPREILITKEQFKNMICNDNRKINVEKDIK
jgi:S-DNA-T family DNA segregation ATPase FtsK/SpoIIIE